VRLALEKDGEETKAPKLNKNEIKEQFALKNYDFKLHFKSALSHQFQKIKLKSVLYVPLKK